MPYKQAYLWVTALIALSFYAFWPSFFGRLGEASTAFLVHGFTAMAWMALLVAQSWSAHRKHRLSLHRKLGLSSLGLFPLFLAGAFLIIHSMAAKTLASSSESALFFFDLFGARLGAYDIVGTAAFAFFFARAIRHRRKVHVHARFLVATALLLLGPALGRALTGPLIAAGWEFPTAFLTAVRLSNALAIAIALTLLWKAPIAGRQPMKWVAGLLLVQWGAMELATLVPAWRPLYESIAAISATGVGISGFLVGLLISWWAWENGKARPVPSQGRTATA